MKAEASFSLKDQLFNQEKVDYLAGLILQVHPDFKAKAFSKKVLNQFPQLELKERIAHITSCLYEFLPSDYLEALSIILNALPPELDANKTDDDFGDFIFAPLSLYLATYGCETRYLDASLNALKETTKRFSAEFSIRFFINKFPDETLIFLKDCAKDSNYHVRRLASEGTRPKLPWAQKLNIHYQDPLPILDSLFADNTRFVTRSVANHLNDIAKLEPELVIETLKRWQKSKQQNEKEMAFITKHAVRTLIKKGNQDAFKLIGFGDKPNISIGNLKTTTPQVSVGEAFEFSFDVHAHKKQSLVIDYVMQFANNGKSKSQKVFKLKTLELDKDERTSFTKKHPMKLMTTRRLYVGEHSVTLQVNGTAFDSLSFELLE